MGEEHITEPGREDMPYGMRDTGFPEEIEEEELEEMEEIEEPEELGERRAARAFPPRGMPRDTDVDRPPGGGAIGEEERFGGVPTPDGGEIIQGGAETDTGQRRKIYPGGAAGSDFDFDAEPATGADIGGELGGDMDPDDDDWLP